MNKAPPPVPKSYQKHKLERASLVEPEIERSTEIPKSISNNSLPNIAVSTTTVPNEPPVADLLSFSPPPTPPPRRRKQRGGGQATPKTSTLDVPDSGGTILDDHSSSDEVDTTSSSGSSSDSPTATNIVAPPLPPRSELNNYVTMLQPNTMDLPLTDAPPPLPPRDELLESPVLMHNSSSAPPLPPRDEPPSAPVLPPRSDVPIVPPRDKKKLSPNTARKTTYTPPAPHKEFDMGPRCNSADVLNNLPASSVSLIDVEDPWPSDEEFGNTLARELLSQASRSSFTEEIAKRLQSNLFMRPSKAVMDTLSNDDPFSPTLPPPLIPSTSSSPQVNRKTDECPSTTANFDPLDRLLDKSDLTKWVATSSQQQQEKTTTTATANGNVLT